MSEQPKIKIIRLRLPSKCPQCGDPMKGICAKCQKHPSRRPYVIDVYDMPKFIKYAECGDAEKPCCVQIVCQREGCGAIFWRHVANIRQAAKQFCGNQCKIIALSASRKNGVKVMCGNPGCGKMIVRNPYNLKTHKKSYCCHGCQYEAKKKENAIVRSGGLSPKISREDSYQMLECRSPKHFGEITLHVPVKGDIFSCNEFLPKTKVICGNRRSAHIAVSDSAANGCRKSVPRESLV